MQTQSKSNLGNRISEGAMKPGLISEGLEDRFVRSFVTSLVSPVPQVGAVIPRALSD
jgi:hypothetical protein